MDEVAPLSSTRVNHQTFSTIVKSPDDLVGLIAYALYKADKVAFCAEHPDADVNAFILAANLPSQVSSYRLKAEIMLEDMTEETLGQAVEGIKQEYIARAENMEKSLGFWRSVVSNTFGAFAASAIWILLVVLVFGSKINFWSNLHNFFKSDTPAVVEKKAD